jgi:ubiquinone/menaquinone biosynthesis C-methylase UbiE
MPSTSKTWRSQLFDRIGAASYDAAIERERLARILGWLSWRTDTARLYRHMQLLSEQPAGTSVLDLPCGGGVAFRALSAEQDIHYVACDLSPGMLRRARKVARERGLAQIEFVEADVNTLPFPDAEFDLCVSYNGLHCFPQPQAAVEEIARFLKPGGRLTGCATIRGAGRREDALIRAYQRTGVFGPGGTAEEVAEWLDAAGLEEVNFDRSGAWVFFDATRPNFSVGAGESQSQRPDRDAEEQLA